MTSDLEQLAHVLLSIYNAQQLAIPWIQSLFEREVQQTDNMFVLFRGNSILTKAMDGYMKGEFSRKEFNGIVTKAVVVGMDYLESCIGDILRHVCDNNVYCEVDPTRLEKQDDLKNNWRRLIQLACQLWERIEESKERIPMYVFTSGFLHSS